MTKEMAIHNLYALKQRTRALSNHEALDMAIKALEQQRVGKWLAKSFHEVYCDNCGFDFDIMTNEFMDKMNYCPNCGACMEESEDKE